MKIKCPICFHDLRPMLDRIGAMETLHSGNYVLCENGACARTSIVDRFNGKFSLRKATT